MAQDPNAASNTNTTEENVDTATATVVPEAKMDDVAIIDRDLDIVIYGATGFTGQYVAKYLATRVATTDLTLKWGIAGRNETKLKTLHNVLKQTYQDALTSSNAPSNASNTNDETKSNDNNNNDIANGKTKDDLNDLPILIGDVMDLGALKKIVCRAKLIISCVGPYRFYGENVVKVCAENGTHYTDICGEPEFMDRCAFKYFDTANKNDSICVHACGFDSIPSDMGNEYMNQIYLKNNGLCSNMEVYISLQVPNGYSAHATTFEAAVHGFSSVDDLRKFRKELANVEWRDDRKTIQRVGPKQVIHKDVYFWSKLINKWSMIFPFADSAVVTNSQGIRSSLLSKQGVGKRAFPQFAAYLTFNSRLATYQAVAVGGFGTLLTKFEFGKKLLLNYPQAVTLGAFSHEGPTEEQMRTTTFESRFFGQGYSAQAIEKAREQLRNAENENKDNEKDSNDKDAKDENTRLREILSTMAPDLNIVTTVTGGDPAYLDTSKMVVETSLCLIEEIDLIRKGHLGLNVPAIKGGVFTPSAVFGATNLTDRLTQRGLVFKVESGLPSTNTNTSNNVTTDATANKEETK